MTTFTKEQLTAQAKEVIENIDFTMRAYPGGATDSARMNRQLIEMALAGMEVDPVADVVAWSSPNEERTCDIRWRRHDVAPGPLYTAPQPLADAERAELENYRNAQQVVPGDGRDQFEEWFKFHHGDEHSIVTLHRANGGLNYRDPHVDLAWIAWKDSRTAMFQENQKTASTNFPENVNLSTNCKKCGGHGAYHCPQMLGTVECECSMLIPRQWTED
ncbi:hypothetical protein QQF21_17090 [Lelliottia sp. V89_10]|uniref:hypothetical protein n=1 Tax=Lelliottia wanjuensis TaxID=3050585 RepID=UPI00249DAD5F|nr:MULTISPECIES: hypothetical protein [unclassified Lelliottia]MDI3359749.1 hypothetical protein [Lelliottia sp. V89_13]MDK9548707.1 hypothetical protein [Lelliottia sp. V89_5]MDK9597339.1 hypothetical protein [Lelliottia sp. V89_10]